MVACAVKACNNSYRKTVRMKGEKIKFFRFPKDPEIAAKWIEVCRKNVNITHGRICSTHFERWCYEKSAQQIALNYSPVRSRKLKLDAIPTLHLLEELQVTERLDVPIPSIHIDDASKSAATPEDIVPVELKATSKTLLVQTVDTESSVAISKGVSENIIVPIPSKSDTSIDYLVIM
ncbi:THAP domain-containing protein 2 [Cyphomyrmex costatus]|uniref:THAP domain-containing protein 2 n=1 Tax=Cyphomyrmex costatus TaxID=456900 RepID=A0A195CCK5_9HYME|nr:THAP domain-containing protein 2 [Cyphomyrmex costatus]